MRIKKKNYIKILEHIFLDYPSIYILIRWLPDYVNIDLASPYVKRQEIKRFFLTSKI